MPRISKLAISSLAWVILLSLLVLGWLAWAVSFEVPVTATGVVFRAGEPVRSAGYGRHFRLPWLESAAVYPTGELQRFEAVPVEVLFGTSQFADVHISANWHICDAMAFARTWLARPNAMELAGEKVAWEAAMEAKRAASVRSGMDELVHGAQDEVRSKVAEAMAEEGICVRQLAVSRPPTSQPPGVP